MHLNNLISLFVEIIEVTRGRRVTVNPDNPIGASGIREIS